VSYCYDALHRIIGKGYGAQSCPPSTPVVTYAYDSGANAKGKLTSLTDQAGTASYSYNILGQLITETRPIAAVSKSTSYSYNLGGSVKTLTYPSGRVVTYTPDSAGRLVSAVDGNGTSYVTSASYNPDNSLKSLLNGSTPALNQELPLHSAPSALPHYNSHFWNPPDFMHGYAKHRQHHGSGL
jgi:YD repeat-containing protein